MIELHFKRTGDHVVIELGPFSADASLTDLALTKTSWQEIYSDASAYGKKLFNTIFPEEMHPFLSSLSEENSLFLTAEDPLIAAIPWEYLRDPNGNLLAARISFVRSLPEEQRRETFAFYNPLEIIAIPVSPVDEERVLNVEGEWRNLILAVAKNARTQLFTLKRVRPPTLQQLEKSQSVEGTTILHFMGHGVNHHGKSFLLFEDNRAHSHLVDAADFVTILGKRNLLVILNSCFSAIVTPTEFGNIAQTLVQRGIPYVLGMQSVLPDNAALVLSETFYGYLLQGHSIEEATMRLRRTLEEPRRLSHEQWLAGIPALYTSLQAPASPYVLRSGNPTIQPDPRVLEQTCDLAALPQTGRFLGREKETSQVLSVLLAPDAQGFVLLHGLGGIGKTSLARQLAQRASWYYDDHVLAFSFEAFALPHATLHEAESESFFSRFLNRLARFYKIPADHYSALATLQEAILRKRIYQRSLLVLDNIETLFDAQGHTLPIAGKLVSFLHRLREGNGITLLTSRQMLPSDWGLHIGIFLSGLSDEAGAQLLRTMIPFDRLPLAPIADRKALSRNVEGHPLSIQLLAPHFINSNDTLKTFLKHVEIEIATSERIIPRSLEDTERQRTLYSCLNYSIRHLTPAQAKALRAIGLFQASFSSELVEQVLDDPATSLHLEALCRLSLLNESAQQPIFHEENILFFELHPTVRWYIKQHLDPPEQIWLQRYSHLYRSLLSRAYSQYDESAFWRACLHVTVLDGEAALKLLPDLEKIEIAYNLAGYYWRVGLHLRAVELLEQALDLSQQAKEEQNSALIQGLLAQILLEQGKPQDAHILAHQSLSVLETFGDKSQIAEAKNNVGHILYVLGRFSQAFALHEQALEIYQQNGDKYLIAGTKHKMINVLRGQGRFPEALLLCQQVLSIYRQFQATHSVAVIQRVMADILSAQGSGREARVLYEQALLSLRSLGEIHENALVQSSLASVLIQQGDFAQAYDLYYQSLNTFRAIGDLHEQSVVKSAIAQALFLQGRLPEALALFEEALLTYQKLGEAREIAATQGYIGEILARQGKLEEALQLHKQALLIKQQLGNERGASVTQYDIATVLVMQGKFEEALTFFEQARDTDQRLGNKHGVALVQSSKANVFGKQKKFEEALALYEEALQLLQDLDYIGDVALIQGAMATVLAQLGKLQEALTLYEQALPILHRVGDPYNRGFTYLNMIPLFLRLGKTSHALEAAWQAYVLLEQHGYSAAAHSAQADLIEMKWETLGSGVFDEIWAAIISAPQPSWLRDGHDANRAERIDPKQLEVLLENTIAVMTLVKERREEWRTIIAENVLLTKNAGDAPETDFFQAILDLIDGQQPMLPEGHLYARVWKLILSGIALGGPPGDEATDMMQVVGELISSPNLQMAEEVVEKYKGVLLQDGAEQFLRKAILQCRIDRNDYQAGRFEMYLTILNACKEKGISEVFAWVRMQVKQNAPLDLQLIPRSVAALLGNPEEKLAYVHSLAELSNTTTDEQLKTLLQTIQLALFGADLDLLGLELDGFYHKAWKSIVAGVQTVQPDKEI